MGDLEQIKVGDSVTVRKLGSIVEIEKVIKVTKTQVITRRSESGIETRWKKSTGKKVGDRNQWSHVHVKPTTEKHRGVFKKDCLMDRVAGLCEIQNLYRLDVEQLEQIVKVFKRGGES